VEKKFLNKSAEATELATERHECLKTFFLHENELKNSSLSVGRVEIFFPALWCLKRVFSAFELLWLIFLNCF
jgi:hypothetical protein